MKLHCWMSLYQHCFQSFQMTNFVLSRFRFTAHLAYWVVLSSLGNSCPFIVFDYLPVCTSLLLCMLTKMTYPCKSKCIRDLTKITLTRFTLGKDCLKESNFELKTNYQSFRILKINSVILWKGFYSYLMFTKANHTEMSVRVDFIKNLICAEKWQN